MELTNAASSLQVVNEQAPVSLNGSGSSDPNGESISFAWSQVLGPPVSLMGASTAAVGLVPGYDRIGIWGAVLLTAARALQGIGVGGEWGGSVLLSAEWSDRSRRGFCRWRAIAIGARGWRRPRDRWRGPMQPRRLWIVRCS